MSSTRILRFGLVLALAVGLTVAPVGVAVAAPERGGEARAGWGVELGEWVETVWGWLRGDCVVERDRSARDTDSEVSNVTAAETNNGQMDPNG